MSSAIRVSRSALSKQDSRTIRDSRGRRACAKPVKRRDWPLMGLAESRMNRADADEYTEALGQVVAGGYRLVAHAQRLGVPKALGLSTPEWVEQRLGGYVRMSIPDRRNAVAELSE